MALSVIITVIVSINLLILVAGFYIIYRVFSGFKDLILRDLEFTRGKLINHITRATKRSDIEVPDIEIASDEVVFRRELAKIKER